jgi:hypothetical protein
LPENHNLQLTLGIVESPSPDDIFYGQTEGSVLRETLRNAAFPVSYNIAVNQFKLSDALTLFRQQSQSPGVLPILHLSMHGNEEGVKLTDGAFLHWQQLRHLLLPISKGKLLLCMSSCYGFSGCRMAMFADRLSPFLAIVGHRGKANLNDLAMGYSAFYHRLFKGALLPTAFEAMKQASGDINFDYITGALAQELYQKEVARLQAERLDGIRSYLQATLQSGQVDQPPNLN